MKKKLLLSILGTAAVTSFGQYIVLDNYASSGTLVVYGANVPANGVSGALGTVGDGLTSDWTVGLYFVGGTLSISDPAGNGIPAAPLALGTGDGSTVGVAGPEVGGIPGYYSSITLFDDGLSFKSQLTLEIVVYPTAAGSYAAARYRAHSAPFVMTPVSATSGSPAYTGSFMPGTLIVTPVLETNPPTIVQQPTNQTVFYGTNVVISVEIYDNPPDFFQWMLNGSNILGATESTYTITNAGVQDLGVYSVVVSNYYGSITSSNETLTMYPYLETPFTGETAIWGQDTTLNVGANGTGPFFYQWYENGSPINGATDQTFTIPSIQFTNAGFYSVVVTSALGNVTNPPAQVVVNPAGVSIGMYPGVMITGTVGYSFSIQSTPNLSNTNGWITMTNLTLEQPQQLWFDSTINAYNPENPQRFYRVVPQQ